jgi:hypothetical protein
MCTIWFLPLPPQATVQKTLCPVAHLDIEQALKGKREQASRNVAVDPDKPALLRSPEMQNLPVT